MTNEYHADGQGSPDSMSADIEAALASVSFPANKDGIVDAASKRGVSNEVIALLNGLSERDYRSADDVLQQIG